MNDSKLLLGTDQAPLSSSHTKCGTNINDTSFVILSPACRDTAATNVAIRRESFAGIYGSYEFALVEVIPF